MWKKFVWGVKKKWQASQGQTQDTFMRDDEWNINTLQNNFKVSAGVTLATDITPWPGPCLQQKLYLRTVNKKYKDLHSKISRHLKRELICNQGKGKNQNKTNEKNKVGLMSIVFNSKINQYILNNHHPHLTTVKAHSYYYLASYF